ncbi:MAG: serine/threonine-protein kinase [Anaerolineales bacterium]
MKARVGQVFEAGHRKYRLEGKIGDGAIGVVRKARRLNSDSLFAVKFLAPELKYINPESMLDIYSRFKREGTRGISLKHEYLVEIIAYEENNKGRNFVGADGPKNPFILMEYIHGRTLEHHIKRNAGDVPRFSISQVNIKIGYLLCDALVYLHERKIVHRDVKPANVYLSKSENPRFPYLVKLGDFGVVKWGDFRASITSGTLTIAGLQGLGTLKYMSPEQALNPKGVTVRSDMYSLGITLFEMFTGQIFSSPHEIFNLSIQRSQRSQNPLKNLYALGLGFMDQKYEVLFGAIYDCFSISPDVRPSSRSLRSVLGRLID